MRGIGSNDNTYYVENVIAAGGRFGGVAATTNGPSIELTRNDVSLNDGDTDDQGTQSAGSPVALTYTICNTGTAAFTDVSVAASNTINLQDPQGSDPAVAIVNTSDSTDDLSTGRDLSIGAPCIEFSATFTPENATDFSFDLTLNYTNTATETLTITVSGSGTSGSASDSASQIIARTQRIISNFMGRRAAQIAGNQPDLNNRLRAGNPPDQYYGSL